MSQAIKVGDLVRVTRGLHKGKIGIVKRSAPSNRNAGVVIDGSDVSIRKNDLKVHQEAASMPE